MGSLIIPFLVDSSCQEVPNSRRADVPDDAEYRATYHLAKHHLDEMAKSREGDELRFGQQGKVTLKPLDLANFATAW